MWVVLSALLILILVICYVRVRMENQHARHLKDNVFLSDKVKSPAVYGIVKPVILLPEEYEGRNLELVLLHENVHIRFADNLWRLLATAIVAVHWFNPCCWHFLKAFMADLELACDDRVLLRIGESRKKEYALTLLECKQPAMPFASAFGGSKLRLRMENILSFRKLTWVSAVTFLMLVGVMFCILLTNAN